MEGWAGLFLIRSTLLILFSVFSLMHILEFRFEFDRDIDDSSYSDSYSDKIDLELRSSFDIARRRLGRASEAETISLVGSLTIPYLSSNFLSRSSLNFESILHIRQNL